MLTSKQKLWIEKATMKQLTSGLNEARKAGKLTFLDFKEWYQWWENNKEDGGIKG